MEEEVANGYGVSAHNAIRVRVATSPEDLDDESIDQEVEFVHQFWEGETLPYSSATPDTRITVVVSSPTLKWWLDIKGLNKEDEEDVRCRLVGPVLPCRHTVKNRDDLKNEFGPNGHTLEIDRFKHVEAYSNDYVLLRSHGAAAGAISYHERAQGLSMFYIETADGIDLSDERWSVLYLFNTSSKPQQQLCGFMTIFCFRNPSRGCSLRVCQALLLPLHQRKGHGRHMLQYLYKEARDKPDVYEVTVEDPAPSFRALRDAVDVEHCLSHNAFSEEVLNGDWLPLSKADVQIRAHNLKIVPAQVEVAYELLRLANVEGEESERKFRLMIKRRLLRLHRDELSNTTSTRKEQLEELYCLVRERYDLVLPSVRRLLKTKSE